MLAREIKAADMNGLQAVINCVRSLRNVRIKDSHIGGKLARELKAADMNSLQAVTY